VAAGQWQAIAGAAVIFILAGVSIAAFGIDAWAEFLAVLRAGGP
jgi:hypothetical protein